MTRLIELTGKKFGRLTVLRRHGVNKHNQPMWMCLCRCGKKKIVAGFNLRYKHTRSCGCLREELRATYAQRRAVGAITQAFKRRGVARYGTNYVHSSSVWYKRAAGLYYTAKRYDIPIGFTNAMEFATYIQQIAPTKCPVFGRRFTKRGNGFDKWSPSIDKIDPRKGYVRGNIQVISMFANKMKQDATPKELRLFGQWAAGESPCR